MYNIIATGIIVVVLGVQSAFAIGDLPAQKVWVTPQGVSAGTPISISAFLYNDQQETVTYTLELKAADTKITTTVVTLAAGSAKTLSFDWKEPQEQTTVSVSVLSALGKNKKDIPTLHGTLGAALVGEKAVPVATTSSVSLPAVSGIIGAVEGFRLKQAQYFTSLRDEKKSLLGLEQQGTAPISEGELPQPKQLDNPTDYAMLIIATTLTSLFVHGYMFYAIAGIIAFLMVRFVVRLFA